MVLLAALLPSASKLDLADTKTAKEMVTGKAIAISSHGNAVPLVQQLLGNSMEMTVVRITIATEVLHPHGLLAVVTITMVATGKVVDIVDLQAVEQLHGNNGTTTLPHPLRLVVNIAMVDTLAATEIRAVATAGNRLWVLLLVLVAALVVSVLHQVWVPCSRTTAQMDLRVALHLHHLRMIFLPL